MKKLIPGMLALLFLICSCSSKKSFLTQRYTNFKHKKSSAVADNRSHARKESKAAPVVLEQASANVQATANPETVSSPGAVAAKPAANPKLVYTRAAVNQVILPTVLKGKEKVAGLIASNSKQPVKLTKTKTLNMDQKHEKRGLLWGVIDALLAIILLVVVVVLVAWLILVLL